MTAAPTRTTDTAALAFDGVDHLLVGTAHNIHRAAARRVFGSAPSSRLPGRVHEAVATAMYGTLSGVLRLSSTSARALSGRGIGRSLDDTAAGRGAIAALNGLVGAELRFLDDRHAVTTAVRWHGHDVACEPCELRDAFPDASGHLAVFVHGLCGSDESWSAGAGMAPTYPDSIDSRTHATPVTIRYNSGLPVGEIGAQLDALLDRLCAAWPARVGRISIIGHGMGGIVARAASHHARAAQSPWLGLLTDVISLGAPVAGAGWERTAHLGAGLLRRLVGPAPEGAAHVDIGHAGPHAWTGIDVTRRWGETRQAVAPLPDVDYRFAVPRLAKVMDYPQGAWDPLDALALLDNRRVAELLVTWLTVREARPDALETGAARIPNQEY